MTYNEQKAKNKRSLQRPVKLVHTLDNNASKMKKRMFGGPVHWYTLLITVSLLRKRGCLVDRSTGPPS